MSLPTPEDVVVAKLRWHRAKDLPDAKQVMDLQAATLDWPYVEHWCDEHGTRALLEELRIAATD